MILYIVLVIRLVGTLTKSKKVYLDLQLHTFPGCAGLLVQGLCSFSPDFCSTCLLKQVSSQSGTILDGTENKIL